MDRWVGLDVTLQTLSALLYPHERILVQQDGVGLYDGKDKSPAHADGRCVLTSHRIVFVSSTRPHSSSAYVALSLVRQTEYWVGFLKSHPKITLVLANDSELSAEDGDPDRPSSLPRAEPSKDLDRLALVAASGGANWVCRVCGMHNVPSPTLGLKCSLCGVARDPHPLPHSAPVSRLGTPPPARPASASPLSTRTAAVPVQPALDPNETGTRLACPVCTFLNHHSMSRCEVCDSALFPPSSTSASTSRPATPGPATDPASAAPAPATAGGAAPGGERAFYAALKEALMAKAWDATAGSATPVGKGGKRDAAAGAAASSTGTATGDGLGGGAGIDAILRGMDLEARDREDSLDDALKDLESLMAKAKEMITLAQSINAQLSTPSAPSPGASADEAASAASLASTSLHSLGLVSAAVTPDLVADSRRYHAELARELRDVLDKGRVMQRQGGVIGLDEVWCLWNRARGVALVSPKDLRLAAPYLSTLPASSSSSSSAGGAIHLRVFPSGLTILHTSRFSLGAFSSRLLSLLDLRQALVASLASPTTLDSLDPAALAEREGVQLVEVAREEGLSVGLAKEMVELVEMGEGPAGRGGGGVVRDEQAQEGTRWYRNYMDGFVWDGQTFE
ncbi:hypothetical protein Rhopal_006981-T1 [Rhodotorula paludigena]|uniref:Vacuolar protein-sorting-associated protein 36 n=1 Tax=Rhodotorula paludigena TaxID=86838 RepID=A0AAV5GY04_9BASI|nr:hypothetical protein Rhopal_006981-T1 [Rhodotorula paludigena]